MKFPFVLLMSMPLVACSQLEPSVRNEDSAVTVSVPNENRISVCNTPALRDMDKWIIRVSQQTPLAWITGKKAVQFADFYTQIVPHSIDLIADTVVVLDYLEEPRVLVMLFKRECLVASSLLEGELFNEVMSVIGAEGWKTLIISLPPGFNI